MKSGKSRSKKGPPRGFTFTISIILLSLTLIAVAIYSQEWRKRQQVSYNEVLPSETVRLQERITSDVGALVGADASVKKESASAVSVEISGTMPFKKEGAPLARLDDYSASLPSNLRHKGYEAILSSNITGSSAQVIAVSDNGSLYYSNNGQNDISTYYHPRGWIPTSITATITCDKAATGVSPMQTGYEPTSESANSINYNVVYAETAAGGKSYLRTAIVPPQSQASFSVSYPDGGSLVFDSRFWSDLDRNYTSISYTKSPSGALILPFDQNSSAYGMTRDYSMYAGNFNLGSSPPTWLENCKYGGCYSFNGVNNYVSGGLQMAETALSFPPGSNRVSNGGFETITGAPDDEEPDSWTGWSEGTPGDPNVQFLSTSVSQSGYAAMIVNTGEPRAENYLYQMVPLTENAPYALELYGSGATAGYAISTRPSGLTLYLQSNGNWEATPYEFSTSGGSDQNVYTYARREFVLPLGSHNATIYLYSPEKEETAYYDGVSLSQLGGLNGGFEYYYRDTGWQPQSDS